jgi:hypothetical protein
MATSHAHAELILLELLEYAPPIGETLIGDRRLLSAGVVLAGRWWHPL